MTDITIRMVKFCEIMDYLEDSKDIFEKESKEINGFPYLDINWDVVEQLDKMDMSRAVIAEKDGDIIACATFLLQERLFSKGWLDAHCLTLYVLPEFRGKFIFTFITKCDKLLTSLNVNEVHHNYSDTGLITLFHRLGYKTESISLVKRVKE